MSDAKVFLKAWIRGQILLSVVLAILYSLGFGLSGLPYGYLIGFFTGFLSWIPIIGSLIGFLTALVVISFNFSPVLLFKVIGVFIVLQILEAVVLAPKILGKAVGLGFLASLAAVAIGALLAGPLGAMFAVPVAAFLKFLLDKRALEEKKRIAQIHYPGTPKGD